MSGRLLVSFRFNHALLGLAFLLAAAAAWPWLASRDPERAPPRAAAAAAQTLSPLPPLSRFTATEERPLFSPTRRPPAIAQPRNTNTGSIGSRYRLVGVVITGAAKRAMVSEGSRHIELSVGDKLDGSTVTQIEQNRVTLHSATGDTVLDLKSAPGDTKPGK